MNMRFLSLALLLLPAVVLAQEGFKLNPTKDPKDPQKLLIPRDLAATHEELSKMLPKEIIKKMKEGTEDDMVLWHHGLGTWIRNNWGLWGGSPLQTSLTKLGLKHPDDMSGLILDTYWRHLHERPLDVEAKVKAYQDYWEQLEKK
jgi:hypothetical protein